MDVEIYRPTHKEEQVAKTWPIWEKEPSEFDWQYDEKEACYIIEGKAKVIFEGKEAWFEAGDMVIFPQGLACRWVIEKKIKKHYKFG